jgi:hypothetical protein
MNAHVPTRKQRAASGLAAQTIAVAVQVELVGTDHSHRALHIVGTIAGAASTVVVADANLEAFALVGRMTVPCWRRGWGGGGAAVDGGGGGALATTRLMVVSGRTPAPALRDWEMTVPTG